MAETHGTVLVTHDAGKQRYRVDNGLARALPRIRIAANIRLYQTYSMQRLLQAILLDRNNGLHGMRTRVTGNECFTGDGRHTLASTPDGRAFGKGAKDLSRESRKIS